MAASNVTSAPVSAILQKLYSAPDAVACAEAATDLANFVNSHGIRSLEEAEISADLIRASKNMKSGFEREGAMVAMEELFRRVGANKGAEPYFLPFLPYILDKYAEQGKAEVVRDAAVKAGKQLVYLPPQEYAPKFIGPLFDAMEQPSVKWKTKVGALELLATFPSRAKSVVADRLGEYIPRLEIQMRDTKADVSMHYHIIPCSSTFTDFLCFLPAGIKCCDQMRRKGLLRSVQPRRHSLHPSPCWMHGKTRPNW